MRKFVTLFYVTFYLSNFCIALTALSMLGYVGQQKNQTPNRALDHHQCHRSIY